jgi:hypothetical protein
MDTETILASARADRASMVKRIEKLAHAVLETADRIRGEGDRLMIAQHPDGARLFLAEDLADSAAMLSYETTDAIRLLLERSATLMRAVTVDAMTRGER